MYRSMWMLWLGLQSFTALVSGQWQVSVFNVFAYGDVAEWGANWGVRAVLLKEAEDQQQHETGIERRYKIGQRIPHAIGRGSHFGGDAKHHRNRPALPFGWGRNGLDWWL